MAVINAISNATGTRIFTLPATAEKVKMSIDRKTAGEPENSPKWNLGEDMYDVLDEICDNQV